MYNCLFVFIFKIRHFQIYSVCCLQALLLKAHRRYRHHYQKRDSYTRSKLRRANIKFNFAAHPIGIIRKPLFLCISQTSTRFKKLYFLAGVCPALPGSDFSCFYFINVKPFRSRSSIEMSKRGGFGAYRSSRIKKMLANTN